MVKNIFIVLGCIGALIILVGTTQHPPQIYYIPGAIAMLATAIYFRLLYFIALELILIAGHSAILLDIGPYTQIFLPILLCLQLLIFYIMFGKVNSVFLILGIFGIALLSVACAYNNQWIFFTGSTCIATYAYYSGYKKKLYSSYIWAVLNTVLAALSLYRLFIM